MPTYVTSLPTGREQGAFLTVDLGGTNCRVCSVLLHGNSRHSMTQRKYAIPRHLMIGSRHEILFDFVAQKIKLFLEEACKWDSEAAALGILKLGFTFSFTYESHSLCHGTMLQWDKGWDIPDAIGRDPCVMLQNAIDRLGLPVSVVALTNDSVGTLMASAYTAGPGASPLVGAIFGTGTNAAYVERKSNIKKLQHPDDVLETAARDIMIVNTEWGAWFDDRPSRLPANQFDDILDKESVNPGEQLLEKRVSAMYLSELTRLAIMSISQTNGFDMVLEESSPLKVPYGISSSFLTLMAKIENDPPEMSLQQISDTIGSKRLSVNDVRVIQSVSSAVVRRSARISGAALAAIIRRSGAFLHQTSGKFWIQRYFCSLWRAMASSVDLVLECVGVRSRVASRGTPIVEGWSVGDLINVGVDGALFEFHPAFEQDLRETLRTIKCIGVTGERRVRIALTKDGSSLGAALVAESTT